MSNPNRRHPFSVLLAAATGTATTTVTIPDDVETIEAVYSNLEVRDFKLAWIVGAGTTPISVTGDALMLAPALMIPLHPRAATPPESRTAPTLQVTGTVTVPIGGGAYLTFIGRSKQEC